MNKPKLFAFIFVGEDATRAIITSGMRDSWMFYSTLKNALKDRNWVHVGQYTELSEVVPYKAATISTNMDKLVAIGLAHATKKGYVLVGVGKAIELLGDFKKRYTYVVRTTKTDVIANVAYLSCIANIRSQITKNNYKSGKASKSTKYQCRLEEFSMSVRGVARMMGYSSATVGSRIEKRWEQMGLAVINRRNKFVCHASEYDHLKYGYEEATSRCFISGDCVYERLMNNIIPVV
jgi:hypothetical protein